MFGRVAVAGVLARIMGFAVDAGDSLHVFENDRRTVLAPGDGSVARVSRRSVLAVRAVCLPDGRAVVSAIDPTGDGIGIPFHVTGHDGPLVRSFGDEVSLGTPRPDSSAVAEAMLAYNLTQVRDGRFWRRRSTVRTACSGTRRASDIGR